MKIISFKKNEAKVEIETADDLWYLSSIVDNCDIVEGKTERKIKIGEATDRSQKIVRKWVYLKLSVEKIEFHKYSSSLRISGKITEGPEDVAKGSYHTFSIEPGTQIKIVKETWLSYQTKKLKEASEKAKSKILVCVFDREDAYVGLLNRQGYELLTKLKGNVAKKDEAKQIVTNFYSEIITVLKEYATRYNVEKIIVGSPAFWKDEFLKNVKDPEFKKKLVMATCSSVDEKAINEVLKRPETQTVLKQDRIAQEVQLVDKILSEISKEGKIAYGMFEVKNATNMGAVSKLIVTDGLIQKLREQETFDELNRIMKEADKQKADIVIIDSENSGGQKLDGISGVAAILRFKLN
ncbi:mRNA surveillance protein pelota [Candidatus Woesearchaeota archaeon]|nr:mRNA surveillance protein pelota [Candidatus Woesearchaeota archaeon]